MLHRHSEHVWYLDRNDASDRPVIGYVKGETFSVLIDAGNSPYHAQEIIDELEKSGLPMPSYVILTHSHWDHCYGLKRLNIPAISNSITHKYLSADKERIWSNEKFREYCDKGVLELFIAEHMAVEYDDFSAIEVIIPQIVYENEMTLHCGGVTVKS
ncbi:MAG: MBL fold metallo-hydrolase, partial [Erysipelotrichaceae bacterium]|nr:MBL fold metallo-hydrolase [Erysipelotrichaceae bacterium]